MLIISTFLLFCFCELPFLKSVILLVQSQLAGGGSVPKRIALIIGTAILASLAFNPVGIVLGIWIIIGYVLLLSDCLVKLFFIGL